MASWGQLGLQEGISVTMELIVGFHDYIMVIMSAILVSVSYLFVMVSISAGLDKYITESHFLEFIWTLVPMIILLFMAFPSLYILYLTEDTCVSGCVVKVIGHQWYWEYQYSGPFGDCEFNSYMLTSGDSLYRNLDVDNRVIIPTSVPSLFMITSADVLHSWTVPSLGVKVDAIPGRLNYISVVPSYSGVFFGQCSELCGSNHSFMPIVVERVPVNYFLKHVSSLMSV